jgi:CubicO group peptidase (beta-lactamase class C family)
MLNSPAVILGLAAFTGQLARAQNRAEPAPYFPPRWEWETRRPAQVGMDSVKLQEVVAFARANEATIHKDSVDLALAVAGEPYNTIVGPTMTRGGHSGVVIRHGYIVLEWGDTKKVDWTFSAAKSYLATTIGLALDAGLIRSLKDPVVDYVKDGSFDSPHNAKITWEHLLQQNSEWQGTLWGKPDWADRPEGATPADWPNRKLSEPGTRYKYNDTRVNLLALLALHVWRRPLPSVLREEVMEPIGASTTWRWHGYENAWIELDGQRMQSVTGGGHWGGGMFISARDMARFGYLFLRNGRWKDRQIVSPEWMAMARTGGPAKADYGFRNQFMNP